MGVSSHIYNKRHASLSCGSRQLASVASHRGHRVAMSTGLEQREKQKLPGRVPRLPSADDQHVVTTTAPRLRSRGCDDMAMWRCLPTGFASRVPDHPPSWDPHPIHREPTGSLSIHDLGCLGQDVGVSVAVGDRHCDSCRRRYDRGRDSAAGDGLPHRVQRVAAQTRPVACAVPFPPTGCTVPEALHDIRNQHSIVMRAAESRRGRRSVDDTLALAARAVALWLVLLSTSFQT
jgi:hypothetical protein